MSDFGGKADMEPDSFIDRRLGLSQLFIKYLPIEQRGERNGGFV
jgi:hypothetical protein